MSRSIEAKRRRAKRNQQKFKLKKRQRKLFVKNIEELETEEDILIINVTEEDCNFNIN